MLSEGNEKSLATQTTTGNTESNYNAQQRSVNKKRIIATTEDESTITEIVFS